MDKEKNKWKDDFNHSFKIFQERERKKKSLPLLKIGKGTEAAATLS